MPESVHVFAPASVANMVCGFDVLGFAVNDPGDEVILKKRKKPGLEITAIRGDKGRLSREPMRNTAGYGVLRLLEKTNQDWGAEMTLIKQLPLGSGLGSSAASAIAGLFAVNQLLEKPLSNDELLAFALESERMASGSAHADNVGPCLLGGFILVRSVAPLDIIKLKTKLSLFCAIVHPHVEVNTKSAREIIRKEVPLKKAVAQWGNVGGMVAGLMAGDIGLVGRSMHDDIIEPVRAMLIPGFDEVRQAALDAGVIGAGLSGSGPSVFALCENESIARKAASGMAEKFKAIDVKSDVFISPINMEGPKILE